MLPTCRIENLARITPLRTGFELLCALLGIIIKLFQHIIQQQLNMYRSNVSQQLSVAAVAAVAAAATTAAAVLLHVSLLFCIWTMNTNSLRTYFHLLISGFCPGIHQSICVVYCLPCRKKKCVFPPCVLHSKIKCIKLSCCYWLLCLSEKWQHTKLVNKSSLHVLARSGHTLTHTNAHTFTHTGRF